MLWSNPDAWSSGQVPGPSDVAHVTAGRNIVIDGDYTVGGVLVDEGCLLGYMEDRSATLTTTGNVIVEGTLLARPNSPAVIHRLLFDGIDEDAYVGGGHTPLDSDVGLWVHGGRLDLTGSPKNAWTRAVGGLPLGASQVQVEDASGWRVGDVLVFTPTERPSVASFWDRYSTRSVQSINGNVIGLSGPLQNAHPETRDQENRPRRTEVLNLTRNVVITGKAGGRSHCMITHTTQPHTINDVEIAHMGPRQPNSDGYTSSVLGRYPLHFHECGNGSMDTSVIGIVVHDSGAHAFVPHLSNGIDFIRCVAHNIYEDAYWWDLAPSTREAGPPSDDILWHQCVASRILWDPAFRGYGLAGYQLPRGDDNVCTECIAVGVQGNVNSSGFSWPEEMIDEQGIWEFHHNIAHNCKVNGVFTWQNGPQIHPVGRTVVYHCESGIEHGAYVNSYIYDDILIWACRVGFRAHAHTHGPQRLEVKRMKIHLDGLGTECVRMMPHHQVGAEMVFINNKYQGYTQQAVHGGREDMRNRTRAVFQDTTWGSATLPHYVRGQALAGTIVREVEAGVEVRRYAF
jgi:hypothetical protein